MQGGYVAEDLYQRLATEGRIAESLTKKELESIRHHLHALLNNDLAMNAAFRPFSTFGNDYTGTSELFLSQHTGLMGMQARLSIRSWRRLAKAKRSSKFARDTIVEPDDTLTLFSRPVLGNKASEDVVDLPGTFWERFGDLTSERLEQVSQLMRAET